MAKLAASGVRRQAITAGGRTVQQACERIRNNALPGRTSRRPQTPLNIKKQWLKKEIPEHLWTSLERPDTGENDQRRLLIWKQTLEKMLNEGWEKRWTAYLQSLPADKTKSPAQTERSGNRSELHKGLSKATSALVTQIRTEKIGLNGFLADRRVPGYSPTCLCGWQRQTAKHIITACALYDGKRNRLFRDAGTRDYRRMLATTRGARAATQFLQETGLLTQFQRTI
jgi:hypothetical protein